MYYLSNNFSHAVCYLYLFKLSLILIQNKLIFIMDISPKLEKCPKEMVIHTTGGSQERQ